jgi:hypothetical protein
MECTVYKKEKEKRIADKILLNVGSGCLPKVASSGVRFRLTERTSVDRQEHPGLPKYTISLKI